MSDLPANADRPSRWAVALVSLSTLGAVVAAALLGIDLVA